MKPLWVLQENLLKEQNFADLLEALTSLEVPHRVIQVIPFKEELPVVESQHPIIAYGSTTLIKTIQKTGCYRPGIFFHPERFRFEAWAKGFGKENLLNGDGRVTTLERLTQEPPEGEFFIRPNNDLKDFSGSVVTEKGLRKFYDEVSAGGFLFGIDCECVVAPVKCTQREWRVFVVNRQIVAGSQYRLKSMLRPKEGIPEEVRRFVEQMIGQWTPEPCFVMDVADWNDRLYVTELNCFNASGFYACNVHSIVKAASEWIDTDPLMRFFWEPHQETT